MNILQTFPFSLTNPTLIWGLSCMSITFFEPKITFRNFLTFDLSFSHSSATKHAKRNLGSVILMNCSPFWIASNKGFFDLTSIMIFLLLIQCTWTCKYTKNFDRMDLIFCIFTLAIQYVNQIVRLKNIIWVK